MCPLIMLAPRSRAQKYRYSTHFLCTYVHTVAIHRGPDSRPLLSEISLAVSYNFILVSLSQLLGIGTRYCHPPCHTHHPFPMENTFVPQAIEIVSKAIEADNAGEYERALALYKDSLARFTTGLKYEKNEARKKLVMERVEGYMKRAEELRDYIAKQNELGPSGQGGSATKKAGDKEEDADAEKKKLRGALAGAIVSEKPNIRWSDVAGLENAKESLKEVRL